VPRDRAATVAAEFAARGLFLARIGSVEPGSGVVLS
jgi:hypothetical protein